MFAEGQMAHHQVVGAASEQLGIVEGGGDIESLAAVLDADRVSTVHQRADADAEGDAPEATSVAEHLLALKDGANWCTMVQHDRHG